MNYRAASLLFLACLSAAPLAFGEEWSRDGWEQAFARRNYRLGMTLTEFRAERFPDQQYSPGAFPVCSDEPRAADWKYAYSQVFGELKEAGIVKCHYYFKSPILNREESARLLAADWGTPTDFYFVKPEGATDYFLYQIISTSKQPIFNELLQAYTAAMGSPTIERGAVQNRLGAVFENVVASWANDVSTLRLEKYYLDLDALGIVLTLTPLNGVVEERTRGVVQNRARRL